MNTSIRNIESPKDFRNEFLVEDVVFCESCQKIISENSSSFFEITNLEELKNLRKTSSPVRHKRNFYTVILLLAGNVSETIGYNKYRMGPGTLYFIPKNQVYTIHSWSDDIKGYHCIFNEEFLMLCLRHKTNLLEFLFFNIENVPFVNLEAKDIDGFKTILDKIKSEYCNHKSIKNNNLLIRLYLNAFLIESSRIYQEKTKSVLVLEINRKQQLVSEYKKLVAEHFIDFKEVKKYAQLLHVNPHYLNDVVKEITGSTASSHIQKQLLFEAKVQLANFENSIIEISENLLFNEQSYFSRFFKKHTGLTPSEFRKLTTPI